MTIREVKKSENVHFLKKIRKKVNRQLDPYCIERIKYFRKDYAKSLSHQRLYERVEKQVLEPYLFEPYNSHNFGVTHRIFKIIETNVKKLNVTPKSKEKIFDITREFYPNFKKEVHTRKYVKDYLIKEKANNDFKRTFEANLDKLIQSYAGKYENVDFGVELAEFQLEIMEIFHKKFNVENIFSEIGFDPLSLSKDFIKEFNPSNRPTYKHYDKFLFDLSEIIKQETPYYIPIITKYLKSFTQNEFNIFKQFEINERNIRTKISLFRKGVNKGV